MNLAEHTICHYAKTKLDDSISELDSLMILFDDSLEETEKEIDVFTEFETDIDTFNTQLTYIRQHVDEFVMSLGEAAMVNGTKFISELKDTFFQNEYLQQDEEFMEALEISDSTDMNSIITLPISYIRLISESIVSGTIMKLVNEYNSSEFVIGINLAIIDFIMRGKNIDATIESIEESETYMKENCEYSTQYVNTQLVDLHRNMYKHYLNMDGTFNTERCLSNLTEEQKTKVLKSKRVIFWILNSTWNELRIKANFDDLNFSGIYALSNKQVPIPEYDVTREGKITISNLDVLFSVT